MKKMAHQILINKKPMKNAITRKVVSFETREQAEAMIVSHRLTFAQPTFSNRTRRYDITEAA